jgi:hypothetical protein
MNILSFFFVFVRNLFLLAAQHHCIPMYKSFVLCVFACVCVLFSEKQLPLPGSPESAAAASCAIPLPGSPDSAAAASCAPSGYGASHPAVRGIISKQFVCLYCFFFIFVF